jgi:CHAT domain-containing protein
MTSLNYNMKWIFYKTAEAQRKQRKRKEKIFINRLGLLYAFCWGLGFVLLITSFPVMAQYDLGLKLKTGNYIDVVVNNTNNQVKYQVKDTQSQLDEGRILFERERFAESAHLWEKAAAHFHRQGDFVNEARSLSYLSLAYQHLGEWQKAEKAIDGSLNLLAEEKGQPGLMAVALNTQGSLKLALGKGEEALEIWQKAEHAYTTAGDIEGAIGSKINQAQALQSLGFYRRAQNLLTSVHEQLQRQPDSLLKVQVLQSLGAALQLVGDLQESQEVLKQSLVMSKRFNSADSGNILFNLGNVARDLQQVPLALSYYQQAALKASHPDTQLKAQLNQLSLYTQTSQWAQAQSLLAPIKTQLNSLPPSRTSVYAAINFSRSLSQLAKHKPGESTQYQEAGRILASGIQQAETLGDMRALAYALVSLGKLYFQTQQLPEALKLTQQAQEIAEQIQAFDIAYQAYWQIGRIRKIQGNTKAAISAYTLSVNTLKSLRGDLLAIHPDVQFSFEESVEPIYRELVELLLESNPSQENLKQARETIEALQLAELDNFFREACLEAQPQQIEQLDKTAAVIYPIILSNRLEIILSIPGKPLLSYKTYLPKADIEHSIQQMRQSLNPAYSNSERLRLYQQLYNWLIRPAESQLANNEVKTLVFVLDGFLRNLPMAALHDGNQYLIEKYRLALSPGMQLLQAQRLSKDNMKVITAGLSEARSGFQPLPAVKLEVKQIVSKLESQLLLNETFTSVNLQKAIESKPFSILHLATHAQFSSRADDTFILTWDKKLKVKDLEELIKSRDEDETTPVELLVLSACQTAQGDNRAILGLAGVAVRSRARSTLATLWAVKDESTARFMSEFYKHLKRPATPKAEALRQAQLTFLQDADFSHPFYWGAFVLVGNWL